MEKVQRIGISIEDRLLARFDKMIAEQGYQNRSEAVRDLVREKLTEQKLADLRTEAIAAVFVVYDHHQANLAQKLIKLQHNRLLHTISSMHIHLDHHNCLEVILLRGRVGQIKKLADSFLALKGVKLGKVNLVSPDE
jgi:CopG family nickel-responsive transcriptional regulator